MLLIKLDSFCVVLRVSLRCENETEHPIEQPKRKSIEQTVNCNFAVGDATPRYDGHRPPYCNFSTINVEICNRFGMKQRKRNSFCVFCVERHTSAIKPLPGHRFVILSMWNFTILSFFFAGISGRYLEFRQCKKLPKGSIKFVIRADLTGPNILNNEVELSAYEISGFDRGS